MSDDGEVDEKDLSGLIAGVRRGDNAALEEVFKRYFSHLVAFAHGRMQAGQSVGDGEGAAASAMRSFVRCAGAGRFGQLKNQQELYRLLIVIVLRKAIKYNQRDRRYIHVSNAADESSGKDFVTPHDFPTGAVAEQALIVHETLEQLLTKLGKEVLQHIVLLQLEGHANPYIAETLCISIRSVQRHIATIRDTLAMIESENNEA